MTSRSRLVVVVGPTTAGDLARSLAGTLGRSKRRPAVRVAAFFGVRDESADALLAESDLVVVATPSGCAAGLAEAAVLSLSDFARSVLVVTFDPRARLRPWRHRAALSAVVAALS